MINIPSFQFSLGPQSVADLILVRPMSRGSRLILSFILLLSVIAPAYCESKAAGTRELYQSGSPALHSKTIWLVAETKFQDTCLWDTRNLKKPPLSIPQAITAARSFLSSRGEPDELQLWSVQLRRPTKTVAGESLYFYVVTFDDSGQRELEKKVVQVVVLLDGSAVPPIVMNGK